MSDPNVSDEAKDTSPLDPEQLSDQELRIIFEIEDRLEDARNTTIEEEPRGAGRYLKTVENRHSRVLLLDGGRGTGKTSLLLTLVHRWHHKILNDNTAEKKLITAYSNRGKNLKQFSNDRVSAPIPRHVKVLDILDFDPLTPGMPLIAGIVQVWRQLADEYDQRLGSSEDDYEDDGPLMDRWYNLFQMAAAGWGTVSHNKSLIEQVLDHQEQVQNWQRLGEDWSLFINRVIKKGKKLTGPEKLDSESVFVIMIDDCDLQVERIRELLPALRMLYHPKVFFLVAADRQHMIEMLQLDFYGQQSKLAQHQNARDDSLWELVGKDRWAPELANSSVSKVFPLKNRWKLRQLSLHELLSFPPDKKQNLRGILDAWEQRETKERTFGALGTYLTLMGGATDDPIDLPPIMPYREAHQIVDQASTHKEAKQSALEAIRHVIGRSRPDDLIRILKRPKYGKATGQRDRDPSIEYLGVGELIALFHKGFREPTEHGGVVLSARPAFLYRSGSSRSLSLVNGDAESDNEIISALLASSMRDDGYGVVAPDLVWDIRLALAWTDVRVFERDLSLDLAFRWQLHEHPSPLRLLNWTKEWRDFIHGLSGDKTLLLERIAYAWIYYQLKWMRKDLRSERPKAWQGLPAPLDKGFNEEKTWARLLSFEPETGTEAKFWRQRTLPLLARPELGLPVEVQHRLLTQADAGMDRDWLRDQRRRRVTDAIIAAADQRGVRAEGAENQMQAEQVVEVFDARHKKIHGADSPWWKHVESPPPPRRKGFRAIKTHG
jgi:hypothetical protein